MAMLGKRFQRTISMSHIGPGSNSHTEKSQVQKYYQQQPQPQPEEGDQPANQWEILKNAEAMMMMMMQATSGSNTTGEDGAREASVRAAEAASNGNGQLQHPHHPQIGLHPCSPAPNTVCSLPDCHTMSSPSTLINSPAHHHFLDACFYCKRRLHPEKDIFIYRGDAAFCTEECRYRQILNDETHSRPSKKGGSTMETAVAA